MKDGGRRGGARQDHAHIYDINKRGTGKLRIQSAAVERAKMNIMQTIGVSLCGAELKQIKDAIDLAKEISPGSEGTATLWADGKKVSWEAAAFAASLNKLYTASKTESRAGFPHFRNAAGSETTDEK